MKMLNVFVFFVLLSVAVFGQPKLTTSGYEFAYTDTVDTSGDSLQTYGGANMDGIFADWFVMTVATDADIEISSDSSFTSGKTFTILADEAYTSARKDVRVYKDYYFRSKTGTAVIRIIVEGR
jgi:hypothetical protein